MNAPYEIPTDTSLQVSAEKVGFAMPETAEALEASIKFKNLVNTELLSERIMHAALQPTTPLRQQLEVLEATRKLAGLDQKKQETAQTGAQFSIQINIPAVDSQPAQSRIIEGTAHEEVQLPEIVGKLSEIRQVHQSGGGASGIDEDDDLDYQDTDGS
jgi:hypothetical protein